ncbi:aryl-sulfate sulfotransferase [Nannocystaceae bacterium ST9]
MPYPRWSTLLALVSIPTAIACTRNPGEGDDEVGETETATETGTATSETTTETGSEPLLGDLQVVLHPNQPMVVDVLVELAVPGYATLTHPDDAGVRVARLDGEGPATDLHFRVRGLAPASEHAMELGLGLVEGEPDEVHAVPFTTNPPGPGYIGAFTLGENQAELVDDDFRFFDLAPLYVAGAASMFVIDPVGRTRWHFGVELPFVGLDEIWVGIKLRPDGSVLAQHDDAVVVYDELGEQLLEVTADDLGVHDFHHDVLELPSGNFLTFTWSYQDVDYPDDGTLHVAGDRLVEFTPAGELVWSWDSFDHLDPQRRRDGFDSLFPIVDPETDEDAKDWTHANGMLYADGVIYVSMRHQDWILAIDHASGDILWRLGDEGDFALAPGSTWFFHPHSPQWQPDGSLLIYDNAVGNPEQPDTDANSHAARFALDFDAMTATRVWQDDDPAFVSALAGDADRTSSGHVLRLDSYYGTNPLASRLRELDPASTPNAIWSIDLPEGSFAYRALPLERLVGEAQP